jgi:hypothetical protein
VTTQYLIVSSDQGENACGPFMDELLVFEGFTGFASVDLASNPLPVIRPGDLVVLTRCFLTDSETTALVSAVREGARLLCVQPSYRLAQSLGLRSLKRVAYPGRISIAAGYPGAGAVLQTHVPIALHEAPDWKLVAAALEPSGGDAGCPAVVSRDLGQGKAAVFLYDLPLAVARIRFGNPDLASYCTTGVWDWAHACDLFAEWVDESVRHLPQADLHTQLMARLLSDISSCPLPRLWYYPESQHRSLAVFQSDDDWSTPAQFKELSESLEVHGATGTFHLVKDTQLSQEDVAAMRTRGHTFSPHANPFGDPEEWHFSFLDTVREETRLFKERFGECSCAIQCHCAPWEGVMSWVDAFRDAGYRLLFAYLSGPAELLNRFMCGSGRPIRFFDSNGRLHDCWQQPILCYDDTTIEERMRAEGTEGLFEEFDTLLRKTVEETHTAFGLLSHPVSFATYSRPYIEHIFDRLCAEQVPIVNGDEWMEFLDMRRGVRVEHEPVPDGLRCVVRGLNGRLALMIPLTQEGTQPTVLVNGAPVNASVRRCLAQEYLFSDLKSSGADCVVEIRSILLQGDRR